MNKNNFLEHDKISHLMIKMTIPAIISMTISAIYNFIDRIYVGRLNPLALTAVGLSMPIQIIIMSVVLLIGIGASSLVSLRLGMNDKKSAEEILGNAFSFLFLALSFICFICYIFIDKILFFIGTSVDVFHLTKIYTSILILGSPITLIGFGLNHSLRARGDAKLSMYIMVLSAILNIILDPIFIFKFNMGISGAAWATILSQGVATGLIIYSLSNSNTSTLNLKLKYFRPKIHSLKLIIKNGLPIFTMQGMAIILTIYLNRSLVIYGGDLALASFTIISSIFQLYHMILVGIIQGNQPIIGFNYGAKLYNRVLEAIKISIISSSVLSVLLWIIILLFPKEIVSIFSSENELLEITTHGLKLYFLMLPIVGFQFILAQYFQAIEFPKKSTLLLLLRFGLILLPLLFFLPNLFGLNGIWYSIIISDLVCGIVCFIFLIVEVKRLKKLIKV